jgi:large subunit ribosomal protein LX
MQAYRISGSFQMGGDQQSFTLETLAGSEEEATEWAYSILGSRHRARRPQVDVDTVEAIDPDQVEDDRVLHELETVEE